MSGRSGTNRESFPDPLEAPFPYFGGKRKIAPEVWRRLGNPRTYVEPFAGSLAVLLGRPKEHDWWKQRETINDYSGHIVNFYRAIKDAPRDVAAHANWPVTEVDLTARHLELVSREASLAQSLVADPKFYDAELAGWWVWGISAWVGGEWCSGLGPLKREPSGPGVYRKMPMSAASHGGKGIHRTLVGTPDDWIHEDVPDLEKAMALRMEATFAALSQRLRRVRILCGDWSRLTKSVVRPAREEITGVFLDPPYDLSQRRANLYGPSDSLARGAKSESESPSGETRAENDPAEAARRWALSVGGDPQLRIAYCSYGSEEEAGEFTNAGWTAYSWVASGGYGLQAQGRARMNRSREVVWFSPACLSDTDVEQPRSARVKAQHVATNSERTHG